MSLVAALPHRKFSVSEYHSFIENGVFEPEERLELWEGEFIEISPLGKNHAGCVNQLAELLQGFLQKKAIVSIQNPIVIGDFSEPQPDISLLERREDFYRTVSATAQDTLLVIEVSDTTTRYDRDVKFPVYAANGIREAWLVDLINDRVEIHSDPTPMGYGMVNILHRGQTARSAVFAEIEITVNDILG